MVAHQVCAGIFGPARIAVPAARLYRYTHRIRFKASRIDGAGSARQRRQAPWPRWPRSTVQHACQPRPGRAARRAALIRQRFIDDVTAQLRQSLPLGAAMRDEILAVLRTALDSTLSRLNLVTREDFDAQVALLARTRERLEALETAVAELERRERPPDSGS